jgi:hypothetical protein
MQNCIIYCKNNIQNLLKTGKSLIYKLLERVYKILLKI